jgi:alpha-glucuronidase
VARRFEDPKTCPEELLLFFHHLPYDYRLKSGKSIVQHIYDTHFWGVEAVEDLRKKWLTLSGRIDAGRFSAVLGKIEDQKKHAARWRDSVNVFFYRLSGVPDKKGRLAGAAND